MKGIKGRERKEEGKLGENGGWNVLRVGRCSNGEGSREEKGIGEKGE